MDPIIVFSPAVEDVKEEVFTNRDWTTLTVVEWNGYYPSMSSKSNTVDENFNCSSSVL